MNLLFIKGLKGCVSTAIQTCVLLVVNYCVLLLDAARKVFD